MKALALKLALVVAAVSHGHHHHHAWRTAVASVYGEGDGSSGGLACGGTLSLSTVGVANKTLPCGRLLRFRYHGRFSYGRVVDRGPFVAGRDFDLAPGLRRRLGFPISVDRLSWSFAPSGGGR